MGLHKFGIGTRVPSRLGEVDLSQVKQVTSATQLDFEVGASQLQVTQVDSQVK
jgi:hypothetical protein